MKLGVLVSGNLGFEVLKFIYPIHRIVCVFTDSKSTGIVSWTNKRNIPCFVGNPRNGKAKQFLDSINAEFANEIEVLVSVNYLFLLEKDMIEIPHFGAINVHGSLLPKYRGRTPHIWAIINGETETGISVHLIQEECDTGPILNQVKVPIGHNDTGADILNKFNKLYPELVLDALKKIESKTYTLVNQDENLATFFGKRSPSDGRIIWDWHRERIRNWVRAQADPYPGAFTYLDGKPVKINKVEFSSYGYSWEIKNGTIVHLENSFPIVKTSNGCLKLVNFSKEQEIEVSVDKRFE
ncbi:methionyl-tRNA formyltransferase [Jiulongibacter sp. NS-SX5]|uniref:methionyl-tRNA formyltransferase n=1 Tax=Jiulongibacter sp. NS-SX5 TaxID=3463854 RepID=UPI004059C10E